MDGWMGAILIARRRRGGGGESKEGREGIMSTPSSREIANHQTRFKIDTRTRIGTTRKWVPTYYVGRARRPVGTAS